MKNSGISSSETFTLTESIDYAPASIVSKTVIKQSGGNISLFAFAQGESLSEHTAPFDALVQVLDGQTEITIGGKPHQLSAGQSIILPGNVPHSVLAVQPFKMLLTMIKSN